MSLLVARRGILAAGDVVAPEPHLEVWLDASDETSIDDDGGAVTGWTDKQNDYTFAQATASDRPTTGASTLNSLNVVDFDADHLTFDAAASVFKWLHDGTEHTIFAVIRAGNVASPDALLSLLGSNAASSGNIGEWVSYDDRGSTSDALVHQVSAGGANPILYIGPNSFWPANEWGVLTVLTRPLLSASGRSRIWWNDANEQNPNTRTDSVSTDNPTHPLDIGAAGNGASPLTGALAELRIYRKGMDAGERAGVVSELLQKWGLGS